MKVVDNGYVKESSFCCFVFWNIDICYIFCNGIVIWDVSWIGF